MKLIDKNGGVLSNHFDAIRILGMVIGPVDNPGF